MHVSKLEGNKIKITLSHTEVICCFGAYDNLLSMSKKTKTTIKILLSDIIEEYYGFLNNEKISADIKADLHNGCVIILSRCTGQIKKNEYVVCFENSENLIDGTLILYRMLRKKAYASSLYTLNKKYYLLLSFDIDKRRIMPLRKFTYYITKDSVKTEYIREYGKIITRRNAVKKLSSAFIKEI